MHLIDKKKLLIAIFPKITAFQQPNVNCAIIHAHFYGLKSWN